MKHFTLDIFLILGIYEQLVNWLLMNAGKINSRPKRVLDQAPARHCPHKDTNTAVSAAPMIIGDKDVLDKVQDDKYWKRDVGSLLRT